MNEMSQIIYYRLVAVRYGLTARYWRMRLDLLDIKIRLVFILTGDCGHACGITAFHKLDGTPFQQFVPEAECPVHDRSRE